MQGRHMRKSDLHIVAVERCAVVRAVHGAQSDHSTSEVTVNERLVRLPSDKDSPMRAHERYRSLP
jgi:hypothetical protein